MEYLNKELKIKEDRWLEVLEIEEKYVELRDAKN